MKRAFSFFLFAALMFASNGLWAQETVPPNPPIIGSGYAVEPVSFRDVRLTDSFWAPRQEINRTKSISYAFDQCEKTGRVSNFWLAANTAPKGTKYVTPQFNDTDIYKGIEAASFALATHPDPEMSRYLDRLICIIGAAQEADGYLYTLISQTRDFSQPDPTSEGKRWHELIWSHELYNAGHMYEAAAAHYWATGQTNFLEIAKKNADLVCKTFGPNEGQVVDVPGHEVIELGLVKLYRATGDKKYLDQAKFFVEMRGRADLRRSLAKDPKTMYGAYAQDATPLTEENEAVGHAVRAMYLYEGAADVAALTGDRAISDAITRIWNNVVSKKIYITGGLGGTPRGEAFAENYVLSNSNGYSETCAQIGGCGWHQRMFLLDQDARYYDVLEQTLYNSLISGISLSGDRFFYPNQLASRGGNNRSPWFGCACCPQNLMRFIASLGGYVYAAGGNDLYVGLYIANKAKATVGGKNVELEMTGNYPWSGDVELAVNPIDGGAKFCLNLRVPGWLGKTPFASDLYEYVDGKTFQPTITVNGEPVDTAPVKGFVKIDRVWKPGDKVAIHFPLQPRWVKAHPNVQACEGRAALTYGPIVLTFESCDNDGHIFDVFADPEAPVTVSPYDPDFLGGVITLKTKGFLPQYKDATLADCREIELTAVPYCVWNNRGDGQMQVWTPISASQTERPAAPTIANTSKISASFDRGASNSMVLGSVADGLYPGDAKNENAESYQNFDFWPHLNTKEWIQYDFAKTEQIHKIGVCWFDDAKRGRDCTVPASWKILVQTETGEWVEPANVSGFPTDSEKLVFVTFDPIRAKAIRLEIQSKPKYSSGLFEWTVE